MLKDIIFSHFSQGILCNFKTFISKFDICKQSFICIFDKFPTAVSLIEFIQLCVKYPSAYRQSFFKYLHLSQLTACCSDYGKIMENKMLLLFNIAKLS